MRVEPEISLTKLRAAAVWAAVRISPRSASSTLRGARRASAPMVTEDADIAQEPDIHLAIEENVLDELHDLGIRRGDGQPHESRVPNAPDVAALRETLRVVWIGFDVGGRRGALGELPQSRGAGPLAAANHVKLIVEAEQISRVC